MTNRLSDDVSVFLGDGNGTFEAQRRFGVGENPRGVATSDLDNDGDEELIVANQVSGSISVLFNTVFFTVEDFDGDGIPNLLDNCPRVRNTDQLDFDENGEGDACDEDIDADGVPNEADVCDFTPVGANVQPDGGLLTDIDGDCDVDLQDYAVLQIELTGASTH